MIKEAFWNGFIKEASAGKSMAKNFLESVNKSAPKAKSLLSSAANKIAPHKKEIASAAGGAAVGGLVGNEKGKKKGFNRGYGYGSSNSRLRGEKMFREKLEAHPKASKLTPEQKQKAVRNMTFTSAYRHYKKNG